MAVTFFLFFSRLPENYQKLPGTPKNMFMEIKTAGDGNRTHIASLEGWSFTIKLRPLFD